MQIPSRFTIAIHILVATDVFQNEYKITSDFLARSINVNPVIIRKTMQSLKGAGLIEVKRGTGGIVFTRPVNEITLLDIFNAIEPFKNEKLFHFHENPNNNCPVGQNIHKGLDDKLFSIQNAMEEKMNSITIEDVSRDVQMFIDNKS